MYNQNWIRVIYTFDLARKHSNIIEAGLTCSPLQKSFFKFALEETLTSIMSMEQQHF
jgi:hypothetical protein